MIILEQLTKDEVSLREFTQAQHVTIVQQSKKILQLEQEVVHLKSLLTQTAPLIEISDLEISDEETIARTQLRLLRQESLIRQLTLDEIRKFDLLTKNLLACTNKKTRDVTPTKNLDSGVLLKELEGAIDE